MSDSNLNSSINSIKSNLLTDIPTATVTELVNIARSLKGINLWNDSTIETAVNDRAITLISSASASDIVKISTAIKSMMGPDIGADVEITSLNTVTTDLIPDTNITHDLGSASNRFNDIYLDGNTIHLGDQTITTTATGLSLTELKIGTGNNTVTLNPSTDGVMQMTGTDSSGNAVAQIENVPSIQSVTNFSDLLSIANPATGAQMMVTSTNRLFIYTGTGWYKIADMANESPTAITGVNSTYDLATDGTVTTITAASSDPEGFPLTWSSAITAGALNGTTVSNVDNVFTITPSTVNETTFTVTFSVTDGVGTATFSSDFTLSLYAEAGGQLFTTNTTWTAPADVTLVHAVCVGAGAENGSQASGGGGLGWKNDIVVVPGQSYTVVVGQGGGNKNNEHSYFISSGTVMGRGGNGYSGGTWVGDGGGNGGAGQGAGTYGRCGGGGAGGYTGNGGNGKSGTTGQAGNGQGGGGGGSMANSGGYTIGGGGVGVYGQGANGVGGLAGILPSQHPSTTSAGSGGSGGETPNSTYGHTDAGDYGGGGGGGGSGAGGGDSGTGAVRIIWGGGSGVRAFPATNTSLAYSNTGTGE